MNYIKKEFHFEAAHRLPSHPRACRRLHGHSYRVVVTLGGSRQENGMLIDFSDMAALVREAVIDPLDHTTILAVEDPLVEPLIALGMEVVALPFEPTVENLAEWIARQLVHGHFPEGSSVFIQSVELYETATASACWVR